MEFKEGQTVEVQLPNSNEFSIGVISSIITEVPKGKGELMYGIPWGNPLPLIGVKMVHHNNKLLWADGNDVKNSTIRATEKVILPAQSLRKELEDIVVDLSPAAKELGEEACEPTSLLNTCSNIENLLLPLMEEEVFACEKRSAILGEFDHEVFEFRSTKVGRMMRHQGVPGFFLKIRVDGYAPPTFELRVTETYWWGKRD